MGGRVGSAEASIVASRFCAKAPCGTEALALILINFDPSAPEMLVALAAALLRRAPCPAPLNSRCCSTQAQKKTKWLGKPVFLALRPVHAIAANHHPRYSMHLRRGPGGNEIKPRRTSSAPSYEKPRRRCPRLAVKTSFRGGSRRPSARRRPSRAPPARRGSRRRPTP